MSDTKIRILNEALALFSIKGYDGVTMFDIANAVGIKPASIYKHYTGKEEIFRSIVKEFEEKTGNIFNASVLDNRVYLDVTKEMLIEMIQQTFQLYAQEPFLTRCRRLFMISAFHRPEIGDLYVKYFIEMPMQYQAELFAILQENKMLDKRDTSIMAYHFYTPILILLQEFDYKKITMEEAIDKISLLVSDFMEVYQL